MPANDFATDLPHETGDVLRMPVADIPDAISALVQRREFSDLVSRIHVDLRSPDAALRQSGVRALQKLGFPV
ncbi:hypothetical protein AL036_00335 [Salipiger aestuarii]|uniref:Uncharacterized protein n=1 Tax=Salipiger aestuarii TaxID=568098 RepID=A0A327YN11_9RHOB|nr:hypothetical protein [Salipiger aestuarii]EIE48877.1 hypothetical protein C357_21995 [Citreicella sp. 357]KAA8610367.1 hypothetical protein AL036_00335 [Salipiger aestuarii]KAA8616383.1 hypothetical protein AL037_00335 [Salipiger aestuarii]KAB2543522.1 hypothetical protein AL035_01655 [Salipiger aestuarii]RAK21911.1 hypothetical protein ATI53_100367 [Salipiger aestuarii]